MGLKEKKNHTELHQQQALQKWKGHSGPCFEPSGKLARFRCTFLCMCLSSHAWTMYCSGCYLMNS